MISDNGHAALPPDFYSPTYNMMFDVLRINDSEVKKTYNPVKMRERKIHDKIMAEYGDILSQDFELAVISETDKLNEHTYKQYVKNARRVIGEHIKKVPLWEQKHPNIKHKGLFVCDETEVYFHGLAMPSGSPVPDYAWMRYVDMRHEFHKPWLDVNLIGQIYASSIDFVIWFCPHKPFGVVRQLNCDFPEVTIIDTRFHFDKYVDYPDTLVC